MENNSFVQLTVSLSWLSRRTAPDKSRAPQRGCHDVHHCCGVQRRSAKVHCIRRTRGSWVLGRDQKKRSPTARWLSEQEHDQSRGCTHVQWPMFERPCCMETEVEREDRQPRGREGGGEAEGCKKDRNTRTARMRGKKTPRKHTWVLAYLGKRIF